MYGTFRSPWPLLFIFLMLASLHLEGQAGVSQEPALTSVSFVRKFHGTVEGKYPIIVLLTSWGDNRLTGSYYYERIGKAIELHGSFTGEGRFKLREFIDGRQSGIFTGEFFSADSVGGVWFDSHGGGRKLSFGLRSLENETPAPWTGTWYLNDPWDEGRLIIGNESNDSMDFALKVVRGNHLGQIEGRASLNGREAIFNGSLFGEEPCGFKFILGDRYVEVIQQTGSLNCGFGVRAYADGRFEAELRKVKPELSHGSGEEKVFRTNDQLDAFRRVVGEKWYDIFAFNMQGTINVAPMDGDPPGCRVVEGAVAGLFATNQAILMHDDRGRFWGLTTNFEEDDQQIVQYVTNAEEWKRKMPPSLKSWYDQFFEGLPLVKQFYPREK